MEEPVGGKTRSLNLGSMAPESMLITTTPQVNEAVYIPGLGPIPRSFCDCGQACQRKGRIQLVVSRMEQCNQIQWVIQRNDEVVE